MPPTEVTVGSNVRDGEVPQLEKSLMRPLFSLTTYSFSLGEETFFSSAPIRTAAASFFTETAGISKVSMAMAMVPA